MSKILGIDISKHQGDFDFSKVDKKYLNFVMIRAGYGKGNIDSQFINNVSKIKKLKIPFGLYWYSYALNVADAKIEVKAFNEQIKKAKDIAGELFKLPAFLDMEDADGYKKNHGMPTNKTLVAICEVYLNEISGCGVYASKSWLDNQLKGLKECKRWVAKWGNNNTILEAGEMVDCYMQQFSSNLHQGDYRLDLNVLYENVLDANDAISDIDAIKSVALHRVKKGETLSGIAAKYKTTVARLEELNGIKNPDKIYADQIIKIDYEANGSSKDKVYIVEKGDTLSEIAKVLGKSVDYLTQRNCIKDKNKIFPGQLIRY